MEVEKKAGAKITGEGGNQLKSWNLTCPALGQLWQLERGLCLLGPGSLPGRESGSSKSRVKVVIVEIVARASPTSSSGEEVRAAHQSSVLVESERDSKITWKRALKQKE